MDLSSLSRSLWDSQNLISNFRSSQSARPDPALDRLLQALELRLIWALLRYCLSECSGSEVQHLSNRSRDLENNLGVHPALRNRAR